MTVLTIYEVSSFYNFLSEKEIMSEHKADYTKEICWHSVLYDGVQSNIGQLYGCTSMESMVDFMLQFRWKICKYSIFINLK